MSRLATSVILLISVLLLLFLSSGATPSHADMYLISATAASSNVTGFNLTYNDIDNDSLFGPQDGDTVVSFSGVGFLGAYFDTVDSSPVFDTSTSPFTDGEGAGGFANWWQFSIDAPPWEVGRARDDNWTYTQSQCPVPIPPSALLFGSGLIPLVWWRRRNRLGR